MKTKKIVKKTVGATIAGTLVIGCGAAGIHYLRNNSGNTVEIIPVSYLNASWIGDDGSEGKSGTVVSDVSQRIEIPDDKVIDQVYVKDGDQVKVGDKLLSYDTTLLELDQELQELTVQKLKIELAAAEKDLEKLKNTTPVARKSSDDSESSDLLDDISVNDALLDDARMITNERELLASDEKNESSTEESENTVQSSVPDTEIEESTDVADQDTEAKDTESSDSEQVLDDNTDVFDADKIGTDSTKNSGETDSDSQDSKNETAKLNQSLSVFLTNLRIKAVTDAGESLLVDTKNASDLSIELDSAINLVPHFREKDNTHFESQNAYVCEIDGLQLNDSISGKVYGIAAITGEDYPEIGGYTLTPITEHSARLTIAFHSGLDKEHEKDPDLDDMYLEIKVSKDEVLGGELSFITGKETSDITSVTVIKENDSDIPVIVDPDEPESEAEPSDSFDPNETTDPEQSETETETDSSEEVDKEQTHFKVSWNHGTNSELRWPEALKLYFYENEEDDATFSLSLAVNGVIRTDSANGTAGDSEVDSDESDENPDTEQAQQEMVETISDDNVIREDGKEEWSSITLKWPENVSFYPGEEFRVWAYAQNYLGQISYDASSNTYTIVMNYQEPDESPLIVLDPISELSYENGENTLSGTGIRAYKGSGTASDPYVFFVTDGVRINNTFVNWAMGFNDDGTIRISDGYVVKLEIRETDSMEGAFIRAVVLDGTVDAETGYAPNIYWIFNSATGIQAYEEEIPDPIDPNDDGGYDPGWSDDDGTYTAEELKQLIQEKELEIRSLKLDQKEAELKLRKYNRELEESTVISAVNGTVTTESANMDDAYMIVNSSSGFYIKTSVGELELDSVNVNDMISCESWETSTQFEARVTQIDTIPSTSSSSYYGWSSTNKNSSDYPVLAIVESDVSLSEYEDIQVKFTSNEDSSQNIYIEKAYVRSENGKSYVYVNGSDNKLHKRYVKTGKNLYGYIEILEGLSENDYITFPYNKNAKEGAATKIGSTYEDY